MCLSGFDSFEELFGDERMIVFATVTLCTSVGWNIVQRYLAWPHLVQKDDSCTLLRHEGGPGCGMTAMNV
jgi:hypothetical protein